MGPDFQILALAHNLDQLLTVISAKQSFVAIDFVRTPYYYSIASFLFPRWWDWQNEHI